MAISGTTSGPELLIELDRAAASRLHRQLADGLRTAIRTGRLAPHTPDAVDSRARGGPAGVPTARRRRLQPAGRRGLPVEQARFRHSGGDRRGGKRTAVRRTDATLRRRLPPGSPDLSSFPRTAWLRALRAGLAEIGSDSFGYVEPQGLPAARVAIADYLRRTRGVQADPATHRALLGSDAGGCAARPRAAGRRTAVRHGGPRLLAAPHGTAAQRRRAGRRADRRGRPRRRRPDRQRRADRSHHARTPVADRRGALGRAAHRTRGMGSRRTSGDRGRLRRGVPLRPGARRRVAGHRTGPGGLHRFHEQDTRAGSAHRLDGVATAPRRGDQAVERVLPTPGVR